jgi:DNA-binding transcriptional LysR family regulator
MGRTSLGDNAGMQLKHLRTFLAVASTLSFTRAGQKVHLVQSSVTEQVQALEADLGVALFDRSQRTLRLTEAGRTLVEYAEALLALAADARAAVAASADGVQGKLAVGALETLCARWLAPLLADFQARHPGLRVDLRAGGTGELRDAVKDGALDLCFALSEPPAGSGLHSECVGTDALAVLLPPGHHLAGRPSLGPADLAGERFLVTAPACAYRAIFERAFAAAGCGLPLLAGEYGSLGAIAAMVRAGLGCALAPRLAVAGLDPALVVLPWDGPEAGVAIHMIWRARQLPAALRHFQDAVRRRHAGSHQPVSAVDVQHAAGGEAVAHEEAGRPGDVVDVADAARR